jgi:Poxvirus A22 protein
MSQSMGDYKRVCAIDAGYRNFAYCIVDNNNWRKPLHWHKEDLWKPEAGKRGVPTKEDVVRITHEWCRLHWKQLRECDCIVLENQLRTPFIIMNTVIHALFFNRCSVVHPMTVAAFFKLPKTRAEKKAASVVAVGAYAEIDTQLRKVDDLADAWLMAVWKLVQEGAISRKELDQQ